MRLKTVTLRGKETPKYSLWRYEGNHAGVSILKAYPHSRDSTEPAQGEKSNRNVPHKADTEYGDE